MPELIPIKLTFHSGLHLGTHGENLERTNITVPSDTIFAALLDAWIRTGGDPEDFAAPFLGEEPDPPFLISSAFPFAGGVRFYPMPVDLAALIGRDALLQFGKKIKRTRFFSEELLRKALSGEKLDHHLFPTDDQSEPGSGIALQGGILWMTVDEVEKLPETLHRAKGKLRSLQYLNIFTTRRVPRVTISRITSASNIYHVGRATFAAGCGLWFSVQWREPGRLVKSNEGDSFQEAFTKALGLLQEDGLGGERTAGYGAFTFQEEDRVTLPDPAVRNPALLLSRYHPRSGELPDALLGRGAAYQMASVGGWLRTPDGAAQRRKRLTMISEGSLVVSPSHILGDLTDVRPTYQSVPGGEESPGLTHPVYRAGFGLAVGWPDSFLD